MTRSMYTRALALKRSALTSLLLCCFSLLASTQTASTLFDKTSMQYKGDRQAQARVLVKKVAVWGKVNAAQANIDTMFLQLLSKAIEPTKEQFKNYVQANGITKEETGGNIDSLVSFT